MEYLQKKNIVPQKYCAQKRERRDRNIIFPLHSTNSMIIHSNILSLFLDFFTSCDILFSDPSLRLISHVTMYYCSTVWANTSQRNIKKLLLVQNFAARIVLGLKKFDHISQGIKSLNWLTVEERLYFNNAVMVFKCVNNLVPEYLAHMFVPRSHIHSGVTRSCNLLHIPRCHLSSGQSAFTYRGCK